MQANVYHDRILDILQKDYVKSTSKRQAFMKAEEVIEVAVYMEIYSHCLHYREVTRFMYVLM